MKAADSPKRITFGLFEVDLQSGELRKNGFKVRLRGQPFDILAMLLERPGEVVTREELQQRLWPDGTFVDFDHSLNTAVNKIREALDDSADNPRFVETIPRRGYRFIAPVQGVEQVSKPVETPAPRETESADAQEGTGLPQRTTGGALDAQPANQPVLPVDQALSRRGWRGRWAVVAATGS